MFIPLNNASNMAACKSVSLIKRQLTIRWAESVLIISLNRRIAISLSDLKDDLLLNELNIFDASINSASFSLFSLLLIKWKKKSNFKIKKIFQKKIIYSSIGNRIAESIKSAQPPVPYTK